jgi:hypothetical protein
MIPNRVRRSDPIRWIAAANHSCSMPASARARPALAILPSASADLAMSFLLRPVGLAFAQTIA